MRASQGVHVQNAGSVKEVCRSMHAIDQSGYGRVVTDDEGSKYSNMIDGRWLVARVRSLHVIAGRCCCGI